MAGPRGSASGDGRGRSSRGGAGQRRNSTARKPTGKAPSRKGGAGGKGASAHSGKGRGAAKGRSGAKGAGAKGAGGKGHGTKGTGRPKGAAARRHAPEDQWEMADRPEWGGVARRGAATLGEGNATRAWRQAVNRAREEERVEASRPERELDPWIRVDDVRDEATGAVSRGEAPRRSARQRTGDDDPELHPDAVADVSDAVGTRAAPRFEARLRDAARAFRRERFSDARRMLKSLADQAPGSPAVRELYGLTFYRLGKWRDAIRELEAFARLSGSSEQDAVLADCYRALGRYGDVERLWDELRAASPDAETVTEGRIVSAGALADQGALGRAIARLDEGGAWRLPKRPKEHHLRRAYALADLYEQAGEVPRARDLFERVDRADPDLTDARRRARALG